MELSSNREGELAYIEHPMPSESTPDNAILERRRILHGPGVHGDGAISQMNHLRQIHDGVPGYEIIGS